MSDEKSTVEYREVQGFPGYRVGDDGTVWSCWRRSSHGRGTGSFMLLGSEWHNLKPGRVSKYGHLQVNLGRHNSRRIGPLVLAAFRGPCPDGMECCHDDGDAANNALENLRWGTSESNTEDQRRHGKLIGGERHGMSKLTNDEIDQIKAMAGTMSQAKIGQRFGIKQPHVSDILNGKKRTPSSHAGRGLK